MNLAPLHSIRFTLFVANGGREVKSKRSRMAQPPPAGNATTTPTCHFDRRHGAAGLQWRNLAENRQLPTLRNNPRGCIRDKCRSIRRETRRLARAMPDFSTTLRSGRNDIGAGRNVRSDAVRRSLCPYGHTTNGDRVPPEGGGATFVLSLPSPSAIIAS
jgi:hypothetical protein